MNTQVPLEDQTPTSDDRVRVWRSLRQMGQVVGVLFEEEIPQTEGVSVNGSALARVQAPGAVARFLDVPFERAAEGHWLDDAQTGCHR